VSLLPRFDCSKTNAMRSWCGSRGRMSNPIGWLMSSPPGIYGLACCVASSFAACGAAVRIPDTTIFDANFRA
jgi:hypothetical protein